MAALFPDLGFRTTLKDGKQLRSLCRYLQSHVFAQIEFGRDYDVKSNPFARFCQVFAKHVGYLGMSSFAVELASHAVFVDEVWRFPDHPIFMSRLPWHMP